MSHFHIPTGQSAFHSIDTWRSRGFASKTANPPLFLLFSGRDDFSKAFGDSGFFSPFDSDTAFYFGMIPFSSSTASIAPVSCGAPTDHTPPDLTHFLCLLPDDGVPALDWNSRSNQAVQNGSQTPWAHPAHLLTYSPVLPSHESLSPLGRNDSPTDRLSAGVCVVRILTTPHPQIGHTQSIFSRPILQSQQTLLFCCTLLLSHIVF